MASNYEEILDEANITISENTPTKKKKRPQPGAGGSSNVGFVDNGSPGFRTPQGHGGSPQGYGGLPRAHEAKEKKPDSILQWFDKSVEQELKTRQIPRATELDLSDQSGAAHPTMVQSTASGVEVMAGLRTDRDTELSEAVDKFAKAEAMVAFEGAIRAAEAAAANVPADMAEEAAVAGAKGFQAELTSVIHEKVPGSGKPIEVVGYVGITRPKHAKKSNFT